MKNKFLYMKCIPNSIVVFSLKDSKIAIIKNKKLECELNEIKEDFQNDEIELNDFIKQTNQCLDYYFSLSYSS